MPACLLACLHARILSYAVRIPYTVYRVESYILSLSLTYTIPLSVRACLCVVPCGAFGRRAVRRTVRACVVCRVCVRAGCVCAGAIVGTRDCVRSAIECVRACSLAGWLAGWLVSARLACAGRALGYCTTVER